MKTVVYQPNIKKHIKYLHKADNGQVHAIVNTQDVSQTEGIRPRTPLDGLGHLLYRIRYRT